MPTYTFKGRNRLNEIVAGERVAADRAALEAALRREQVVITSVKEKGKSLLSLQIGKPRERVKTKQLAIFTRQFSVMLDAGLPLVQCLDILSQQQDNAYFAKVLERVREDVESGSTLADSMARHPKVFDQLYVNMVEAGETGRARRRWQRRMGRAPSGFGRTDEGREVRHSSSDTGASGRDGL